MKTSEIIAQIHEAECDRYLGNSLPYTLKKLKANEYGREEITTVLRKRYELSHHFNEILSYILTKVKTQTKFWSKEKKLKFVFAIEQNLQEENGELSEYGGPHIAGRKTFLDALGVNYDTEYKHAGTFIRPTGGLATQNLLRDVKELIDLGPIEAISVLWYWENRISLSSELGDYWIMLKAFEKAYPEWKKGVYVEGDIFWHLYSHAIHDEFHAKYCEDALILMGSKNSKKVEDVCAKMRKIFDEFWESIDPTGGS